jgi:hypothetical protein
LFCEKSLRVYRSAILEIRYTLKNSPYLITLTSYKVHGIQGLTDITTMP